MPAQGNLGVGMVVWIMVICCAVLLEFTGIFFTVHQTIIISYFISSLFPGNTFSRNLLIVKILTIFLSVSVPS
jgi:hypothetical protein